MHSFILIDMSSSMQNRWSETKDAVNGFVASIAKTEPDCRVTVLGFALEGKAFTKLTPLRAESTAVAYIPLGFDTPDPSGMTPLYDALSLLVPVMAHAVGRRSIMVVTDGEENASVHVKAEGAKALITQWQKNEWDVTFLGADFNAFGQAAKLGLQSKDVLNATSGNFAAATEAYAGRTRAYAGGVAPQSLNFSDADRKAAQGQK